ncbi:MAG TPA: dienelactone hydrolase family protein [Marmoricola sp.]|nr:dienelactone hydrolase family protein [Marmoricola sp.]
MPMIEIPAADGTAEAYVAGHEVGEPRPGVLFFIDAFGLRLQIEQMVDRIANWGYVVLAPNVFYRSGNAASLAPSTDLRKPGAREAFLENVKPRMQDFTVDRARRDITAYLDVLRSLPAVAASGIGVTGFCLGARIATYAAGDHPDDVAAVGGFHGGRLVTDADDSPHLGLANARAEFVYGHAENDASMLPEQVAALGKALAAHGLRAKNEIYEGAAHGYTMADTSMYDEVAAERAFDELRSLFERSLTRR